MTLFSCCLTKVAPMALIVVALVTGCAYEAKKGDLGPRGHEMPAAPGLFSGENGEFVIISRDRVISRPEASEADDNEENDTTSAGDESRPE